MKRKAQFKYMFGERINAVEAMRYLLDHESFGLIASLRETFTRNGNITSSEQVEPIDTGDVTHVTVRRLRASYFEVTVNVEYHLEGTPSFTPYGFDGDGDRPRLVTWQQPDEATNPDHWYPDPTGMPFTWGVTK